LILLRAITLQKIAVEKLLSNNLVTRAAQSTKDSGTILKAFQNISCLCDVFQVSFLDDSKGKNCTLITVQKIDTQLHTEVTVENVLQVLSLL